MCVFLSAPSTVMISSAESLKVFLSCKCGALGHGWSAQSVQVWEVTVLGGAEQAVSYVQSTVTLLLSPMQAAQDI